MNPNEVITVEYSVVQKCYHVTTLWDMLTQNHQAVKRGINNGYLLLGLFHNYEVANEFIRLHREENKTTEETEAVIQAINKGEPF